MLDIQYILNWRQLPPNLEIPSLFYPDQPPLITIWNQKTEGEKWEWEREWVTVIKGERRQPRGGYITPKCGPTVKFGSNLTVGISYWSVMVEYLPYDWYIRCPSRYALYHPDLAWNCLLWVLGSSWTGTCHLYWTVVGEIAVHGYTHINCLFNG